MSGFVDGDRGRRYQTCFDLGDSALMTYYALRSPRSATLWADSVTKRVLKRCRLNNAHIARIQRASDVALEVKHNRRDQWMIYSVAFGERVIHAALASELQRAGISGYRTRPASVRFRDGEVSKDYVELIVTGWAGVARPDSGVHLRERCAECHCATYSPLLHPEHLIDWNHWDGGDFFYVWPLVGYPLLTDRVAKLLRVLKVKSFRLDDPRELGSGYLPPEISRHLKFGVARLSEHLPADIAEKYGRELGLE